MSAGPNSTSARLGTAVAVMVGEGNGVADAGAAVGGTGVLEGPTGVFDGATWAAGVVVTSGNRTLSQPPTATASRIIKVIILDFILVILP